MSMPPREIKTWARKLGDDRGPLIAHWGLTINNPPDALFEIQTRSTGSWFGQQMYQRVTEKGPALDRKMEAFWEIDHLGYTTTLTNAEIKEIGDNYCLKHPTYYLIGNNCQDFVKAVFKGIRETGRDASESEVNKKIDALETEPKALTLEGLGEAQEAIDKSLTEQGWPKLEDLLSAWAGRAYEELQKENE